MDQRNISYIDRAWEHLDRLTKPPRSLGRVEDIAAILCEIQQTDTPKTKPRSVLVFAGDHGVCEEAISAFPQSVTGEMLKNMASGGAAVSVLSKLHQAKLRVIDVGVKLPVDQSFAGVERHVIRAGTRNMMKESAMTKAEMEQAIEIGKQIVQEEAAQSAKLIIFGEMGIGNTTSASAICAAILQCSVLEITGRGTGLDNAGLQHKISVIERAMQTHADQLTDPYSILTCLGGFEIAAMVGGMIEAGKHNLIVLLDGFIVSTAALIAASADPVARTGFLAGHVSVEPGHRQILNHLRLTPILDLNMRLGEASGALISLPIIDAAATIYNEMATFESAGVSSKTTS